MSQVWLSSRIQPHGVRSLTWKSTFSQRACNTQKYLIILKFYIYVLRGVCEGQTDVREGCQYAQKEKAPSSHSPPRYMLFCEPSSKHLALDSPSCCPCPRPTTSPQNQKEEEEGFEIEVPTKTTTLMKATSPLPIVSQLRFAIYGGTNSIICHIVNHFNKIE